MPQQYLKRIGVSPLLVVPEAVLIKICLKMLGAYAAKFPVDPVGRIQGDLKKRPVPLTAEFLNDGGDFRFRGIDMFLDEIVPSQRSNPIIDEMAIGDLFDFEVDDPSFGGNRSSEN